MPKSKTASKNQTVVTIITEIYDDYCYRTLKQSQTMVYYCCYSFVCGSNARQPIGVGTQLYLGVSMHWIIDVEIDRGLRRLYSYILTR